MGHMSGLRQEMGTFSLMCKVAFFSLRSMRSLLCSFILAEPIRINRSIRVKANRDEE